MKFVGRVVNGCEISVTPRRNMYVQIKIILFHSCSVLLKYHNV